MAAVFGWDIVLNERGWAMVIAGSAVAASGILLLGIAAVASRLGRIRSELVQLREGLGRIEPAMPSPPILDPVAAVSASLAAGTPPARAEGPAEPVLPLFLERRDDAAERDLPERAVASEKPAEDSEAAGGEPGPAMAVPAAPGSDDAARRGDDAVPDDADRRGDDAVPDDADHRGDDVVPVPPEAAPVADDAPAPPAPAVIGSYTSGDNRYVMFADGSIEAETPNGVFRFGSLDELKEFVAAGGEGKAS